MDGDPQTITTQNVASLLPSSTVVSLGSWVAARAASVREAVEFFGATLLAIGRLIRDRPEPARRRLVASLRDAGLGSLPIVALIGLVAGLVLTLLGTKELGKIGVQAAIPRLVGVVVLRELGVLIVGVALAGRVAASYAAEVKAAGASAETEAQRLRGLGPIDVEVAPRVVALLLASPLLLAYANTMAIAGSVLYAAASWASAREHADAMLSALALKHVVAGLTKACAFGFVVACAGCYHGLRGGRTPDAVGRAVRRAVVAAVLGVGLAEVTLIFAFKWLRF